MKALILSTIFTLFASQAFAEVIRCEREGSTRSYDINLNAYNDDGIQWAAVDFIQYPGKNTFFYTVKSKSTSSGKKILLNNENIYVQADRDLILREKHNGEMTLEVFWIVGCTGFCTGGQSGSIIYSCERVTE